ncbi:MAG TPA: vitamin B12-dependent ribonucleotide reductase [Vicinamibacteria bacterium]|nr:vitamin B12-dependent ribonucleotide reductase [Vicinamibacteria bacterium]
MMGSDSPPASDAPKGLRLERTFTQPGISPYDTVAWDVRDAIITDENGDTIFKQERVEVPKSWSQMATNIVASKYFHGSLERGERENSARQLVGRVVTTLTRWGVEGNYFDSSEDAETFEDELTFLLLNQYASFNSPVWFNCGIEKKPQCSACFINSVEDTMESILNLAKTEGMLFKWGSGTGSNLSTIRSSRERLSGGGIASGPVSFMKGYDAFAGVIRSGGKTRRAAKMVILNVDHPDIIEFIECKLKEERKAWTLIDAGYDGSFNGEAYASIFYQNANHSVRVTDEFMNAVEEDREWETPALTTGEILGRYQAREILKKIAESTHACGDPGMQFDTTINRWHTSKNSGRITASNPCSEYMYLDDSACNLASLNLMKFFTPEGDFDVRSFRKAVDVVITAMEIIVGRASYPTDRIGMNSEAYRPLGIGYANLGALLMFQGIPYDSDRGRDTAAAITAVMTGEAYAQSARIASHLGPFDGYERNRGPMVDVMEMHRDAVSGIDPARVQPDLYLAARQIWDETVELGRKHGYRNGQASVLAPTGTIGLMMDCDTTGVEPDLALVKYKKLVGGGLMKIVNQTLPNALRRLGYPGDEVDAIVDHVDEHGHVEGAPYLRDEHLSVFDCAVQSPGGTRAIHYMGHVKMMAAVQPFLSGAISKTVNMPNESTVDEIMHTYVEAWRLGLKAIAIYRDGSKRTQPLNTSMTPVAKAAAEALRPIQRKLPVERQAITHKFNIAGHEGYITVGMYDDGSPGEIFINMSKEGSAVSGLMDAFARAISYALQYGVPLEVLVDKFAHTRFEPSGFTGNAQIPYAKSITDYIFRWLALKFLSEDKRASAGLIGATEEVNALAEASLSLEPATGAGTERVGPAVPRFEDAPPCSTCGSIMVRNGSCYKCLNCGSTSGCS